MLISQKANVPAPKDITAYLRQRGWQFIRSTHLWAEYAKDIEGEKVFIEVPQLSVAQDYPRVVGMLLEDLARLESRTPADVLGSIEKGYV